MTVNETRDFGSELGDYLMTQVQSLVEDWIQLLRRRLGTRTVATLSHDDLRNHIPPVLQSLARFVGQPIEAIRSDTIGHLRYHAQIRRTQGYEMDEILAEFDLLAAVVSERALQFVAGSGDSSARDAADAVVRMGSGLREMSYVVVSVFREVEVELSNDLSERMEEFASALVHELAQPLNTIQLASELIDQAGDKAGVEVAEFTNIQRRAIASAQQLIEGVRVISSAEGARRRPRWAGVRSIVEQNFEELRPLANARGVELRVAGDLPAVELDSLRLHLGLLNVLNNGIKYSNPESEAPFVEVSARREDEDEITGCVLLVRDNGIGVPDEAQAHVFQRQFRANPEHAEGLGLGLYLAHRALEGIGGRVWIEESSPEGSTFGIYMRGRECMPEGGVPEVQTPLSLLPGAVRQRIESAGERDES